MSDLSSWWGGTRAEHVLVVAKDEAAAAKIAGVRPADLPFKYRKRVGPLPFGVARPGLYRNVGGAWVRDEPANPPIGPELRELLQSAPMSALAALRVAASLDVSRAVQAVFAEVAEGDRQLAEDTWNRWAR